MRRVAEWQDPDAKAVFFLDSVDEAKILQATDFYRALDRFLRLVGRHNLARATIVISSRITEWLPTTVVTNLGFDFRGKALVPKNGAKRANRKNHIHSSFSCYRWTRQR